MGKTMSEKILASAAGIAETTAGEILWVHVAKAMMDDILGPRVEIADQMKSIRDEVWDPSKVVVISDHYTPPASVKQAADREVYARMGAGSRGQQLLRVGRPMSSGNG